MRLLSLALAAWLGPLKEIVSAAKANNICHNAPICGAISLLDLS